jgi:hypothetical protein
MPLTTYTAGEVLTAASLNANFSFAAGAGAVVQVKSTFKSDTFTMASTTFADVTGLSVSITPTSASNKILVLAGIYTGETPGTVSCYVRLLRDSTLISEGDAAGSRTQVSGQGSSNSTNAMTATPVLFLDSPNTASAVTYKIQIAGNTANTVAVNRSVGDSDSAQLARGASSITVFEVTP